MSKITTKSAASKKTQTGSTAGSSTKKVQKSGKSLQLAPVSRISRTTAVEKITSSGGRFIRVSFTKLGGESRTVGGKFKGVSKLGYIQMVETKTKNNPGGIKSLDPKNIQGLSCNGQSYLIRK